MSAHKCIFCRYDNMSDEGVYMKMISEATPKPEVLEATLFKKRKLYVCPNCGWGASFYECLPGVLEEAPYL